MATERVIACTSCKYVVPFQSLNTHLQTYHNIPARLRRPIVARYNGLPAAQTNHDLQLREDGSAPLHYLLPPAPGFRCLHCPTFKTVNRDRLLQHAKSVHGISAVQCRQEETRSSCFLQKWTNNRNAKYWVVGSDYEPEEIPLGSYSGPQLSYPQLAQPPREEIALLHLEAEEERRLLHEVDSIALDEELEHDEKTEWLRGCEWPVWFTNKPLHLIVAAAALPSSDTLKDFLLGLWNGVECISPAASERVIWKILEASKVVFGRCEETLKHTPRVLRCWLRSWTPSFLAFPFELPQREQTKRRYYGYHERFLCYLFRIWALSRNIKEPMVQISGLRLTAPQVAIMARIWNTATSLVAEVENGGELSGIPSAIHESLFQLFIMFWTDICQDGRMENNAIVHFSGVLGIHPTELIFRKPYDYTPYLSALIWVGRLLILEYALPLQSYTTLQVPWLDRTTYRDQAQHLREYIRPKYLQRGCLAPIGYLIERLQHGRAIARREGPRTNISWSPDGLALSISDSNIPMREFRAMIHGVVARTRQLAQDLLFDWWPEIGLDSMKDDLGIHRVGYSFLANLSNGLQNSFRVLSKLAFSKEGGFSLEKSAGKVKIRQYLQKCDCLVQLIYAAVYMTCGMPPRVEELRLIRWADTITVQRNAFIYRRQIILIFSYNKANTNTNNSFYIVRSPCPVIQNVLFAYLAYIRPFRDFIARQIDPVPRSSTNPHLFSTYDQATGCFSPSMAHNSLKRSSPDSCFNLNSRVYRQIAVSIAKKHLPSIVAPFDPNTPKDYNGFLKLLSFQTGHKPATHAGIYALEHGFPAKLQPDLIDRYLENSRAWHEYTMLQDIDVLNDCVNINLNRLSWPELVAYCPDNPLPKTPERVALSSGDGNIAGDLRGDSSQDEECRKGRKKQGTKRKRQGEAESPTTRKIIEMQQQLDDLLQERALSKKRKPSKQEP